VIPSSWPLLVSAVLFAVGVVGVLVRRNAIVIFMSVELMLNAANLALVAFSRRAGSPDERGSVFVVFIFVIAAAEVAVGLAIVLAAYRNRPTVDGSVQSIEVNIFDFDQDIYGQTLKVSFIRFMREDIKFEGLENLRRQMIEDQKATLQVLGEIKSL